MIPSTTKISMSVKPASPALRSKDRIHGLSFRLTCFFFLIEQSHHLFKAGPRGSSAVSHYPAPPTSGTIIAAGERMGDISRRNLIADG